MNEETKKELGEKILQCLNNGEGLTLTANELLNWIDQCFIEKEEIIEYVNQYHIINEFTLSNLLKQQTQYDKHNRTKSNKP